MPLVDIKLLTIDLDGTLVDSVLDLHAAVNGMQASLVQTPRSVGQVRSWVGNGIDRLVHRAITDTMNDDAPAEQFNLAMPEFMAAYHCVNGKHACAYPGVMETLQALQQNSYKLVCVTNKAREFTLPLLQALGMDDFFELVVAGDDVKNKKPAPDALLQAADQFNVEPANAMMVGDSISDIRAAKSAGFTSVCVSYGYNHGVPVRQLEGELQPDYVLDEFGELHELLCIA